MPPPGPPLHVLIEGSPMRSPWLWLALVLSVVGAGFGRVLQSAPESKPEPHRSPLDVVVLPDGRRAVTANHTADSVSLIDLAPGKVLAELPCGKKPAGLTILTPLMLPILRYGQPVRGAPEDARTGRHVANRRRAARTCLHPGWEEFVRRRDRAG